MAWSWPAACSARADWDRFHLSGLFCAPSVCGLVLFLSGQRTPSGCHHMRPGRSFLPVGLSGVWFFRCSSICQRVQCGRSRYELLAGLGYVRWTRRRDECMESLQWLLAGPLVNSTGGDWMLCTSSRSHAVMGIVLQGLGNVSLFLVLVRHICANPVHLGHQRSCHSNLVCQRWWEVKSRYRSVWVFSLYTNVDRDPSRWWVTKLSRTTSDPFDPHSMVNLMVGSTMLRWSKNWSISPSGRAVKVSSTYHFQKGGYGQVVRALSSTSFITRLATVTDTGDSMAVPQTCWNTSPL